jgi:hypothetical protein
MLYMWQKNVYPSHCPSIRRWLNKHGITIKTSQVYLPCYGAREEHAFQLLEPVVQFPNMPPLLIQPELTKPIPSFRSILRAYGVWGWGRQSRDWGLDWVKDNGQMRECGYQTKNLGFCPHPPLFGGDWGLNSGIHTCQAGALLLESYLQSIILWLFWRWKSYKLFAWAGIEPQSSQAQPPQQLGLQMAPGDSIFLKDLKILIRHYAKHSYGLNMKCPLQTHVLNAWSPGYGIILGRSGGSNHWGSSFFSYPPSWSWCSTSPWAQNQQNQGL